MVVSEASFVQLDVCSGVLVARITCPMVGQREAPIVQEEIETAASKGRWHVVIDLSDVTMLASMGLGTLITLSKSCKAHGGKAVAFGLNDELKKLVKMTRLDRVLTIAKNRDAALKQVS